MSEHKFETFFSRDFSLPSVEAWVRGEDLAPEIWTNGKEKHSFLPYIITVRDDDTVAFNYHFDLVEWHQDLLVRLATDSKDFPDHVAKMVEEKISFIRPIYEAGKPINHSDLVRFLKELEESYPWLDPMWWYSQMSEERLSGLELTKVQKIRTDTDPLCNSSDTVIRESLKQIYPELGEFASVLKIDEICNNRLPQETELEERYGGYFFGNGELLSGVTTSDVEKHFGVMLQQEDVVHVDEIKGQIAQKGIVRGKVRRVMGHRQVDLLEEGEILVSPMTIPDFLPAMKKAAAFVTDEGGIICHASIVARELGIPCITGTKIATQVLKDGMMVEVNADEGIVKILG